MKSKAIILIFLIFTALSCRKEVDASMTEKLIQNNFKISKTTYGGITGETEISYDFVVEDDSVKINIIHHFISPKEKFTIKIGRTNFNEIKNNIICLSKLNIEREPKRSGCQPPFESGYLITSKFSEIKIYPSNQDTCQFVYLLPDYEPLTNLLNEDY